MVLWERLSSRERTVRDSPPKASRQESRSHNKDNFSFAGKHPNFRFGPLSPTGCEISNK
jgi:hypothetical protein